MPEASLGGLSKLLLIAPSTRQDRHDISAEFRDDLVFASVVAPCPAHSLTSALRNSPRKEKYGSYPNRYERTDVDTEYL